MQAMADSLPAAEDVVEGTIGTMDDTLKGIVELVAPGLDGLAATLATQAIAVLVLVLGGHLLSWAARKWCQTVEARFKTGTRKGLMSTMTLNILKPMSIALPYLGYLVGFMRLLTGLDNLHLFCTANRQQYPRLLEVVLRQTLHVTEPISAIVAKVILVVLMASLSWTVLLIKDELVNAAVGNLSRNSSESQAQDLQRVMVPFNSLSTWFVVAACALSSLMVFGFNPQPLLAVGSVSGIIIGFASQEILLNLFSGVTMFITHPFVVGDLVELRAQMTWLTKATVVKIRPLRTMFLTEDNQIMTLPNRVIMDATVINHNQTFASSTESEELAVARQRVFKMEFKLDMPEDPATYGDKAKAVIQAILVRLSTMKGLRKDTIGGFVSDYEDDRFVICITAIGDSSEDNPFEHMQQEFILNCYNGRFKGVASGTPNRQNCCTPAGAQSALLPAA